MLAANPDTVVVVNAAAPLRMDWAGRAPAILWAGYGGQEAGGALADLLFGEASPGGRLPTTFPRRLRDHPAHRSEPYSYPGTDGRVEYREGIFLGYRHFDREGPPPLFPFGHGLTYTRFSYGPVELESEEIAADEELRLCIRIQNTGSRPGQEVVQCYLHDCESSLPRPEQELVAFAKLELLPGESRRVEICLDRRALSFWDPARHAFVCEPGEFELRLGRSSRDIRARARFTLLPDPPV